MKTMSTFPIARKPAPLTWFPVPLTRHLRTTGFFASLVLLLFTTFVPLATAHATTTLTSDTTPYAGTPNTYQPQAPSTTTPPPLPGAPAPVISGPANPSHGIISHGFTPSMQPLALSLSSVASTGAPAVPQAAHAVSSDGRLEVSVPPTALTTADIAAAGGSTGGVQLAIDEVAPPSGSTDGGSGNGLITLGTYLFQLQDRHGHEVGNGIGLRQPITVTEHLPSHLPVPASQFGVNPKERTRRKVNFLR